MEFSQFLECHKTRVAMQFYSQFLWFNKILSCIECHKIWPTYSFYDYTEFFLFLKCPKTQTTGQVYSQFLRLKKKLGILQGSTFKSIVFLACMIQESLFIFEAPQDSRYSQILFSVSRFNKRFFIFAIKQYSKTEKFRKAAVIQRRCPYFWSVSRLELRPNFIFWFSKMLIAVSSSMGWPTFPTGWWNFNGSDVLLLRFHKDIVNLINK